MVESGEIRKYLGETPASTMEMVKVDLGNDAVILDQRMLVEISVASGTGNPGGRRTFYGTTLSEAMIEAREVLGEDAVLLSQREIVELTAASGTWEATEVEPGPVVFRPKNAGALLQKTYGASPSRSMRPEPPVTTRQRTYADFHREDQDILSEMQVRLEEIERLARRSDRPSVAEPLLDVYMKMMDNEVTDDIARHLVERLNKEISATDMNNPEKVQEAVLTAIARLMPISGDISMREDGKPTVVVVVGPTGVGKTTSIAKLATQFRVHHKRRVGLITEDTSRPGGMEQLRSVAQLLNIPLSVADTPDRMRAAISQAQDRDIVLIDTAGRVPKDTASLKELAALLKIVKPDEVHLALCGFSGHKHILDLIARFSLVKFNKILLTKLDEAITYGILMTIAAHMDCGLSYITTGQDYMENIEASNARMLARLVLGEVTLPRCVSVR